MSFCTIDLIKNRNRPDHTSKTMLAGGIEVLFPRIRDIVTGKVAE